jgi:hypothetical protein
MSITRRLSVFALMALSAGLVHARDLTGAWKGAFDFQGESVPLTITLKADGSNVTGQIEGFPAGSVAINDGHVADGKLTFWHMTDYQGTKYKLVYTGKVSDDQIQFSFGTEDGQWATQMTAKREQAAAAGINGAWKGAFEIQGQSVPLTINLKEDGGKVTGTVEGLPSGAAEIKDGKLADGKVTFWLTTDYQGTAIKLVYTGSVGAGQIHFQFGTEDGSWGAEFVAKLS